MRKKLKMIVLIWSAAMMPYFFYRMFKNAMYVVREVREARRLEGMEKAETERLRKIREKYDTKIV